MLLKHAIEKLNNEVRPVNRDFCVENRSLNKKTEKKSEKGFSLAELMMVIGILLILLLIAAPGLISIQRNLRQKELDAKAEVIYHAVQNQLIKLYDSGNSDKYEGIDGRIISAPSDAVIEYSESGEPINKKYYYILPGDSVCDYAVTAEVVDPDLLNDYWVIEYIPAQAGVYSVFYSEKINLSEEYPSGWALYDGQLRIKENRIKNGAWVGYYGGDHSGSSSSTDSLKPTLVVTNADKLTALLQCYSPVGVDDLEFFFTLTDSSGNTYSERYTNTSGLKKYGRSYYINVTLDDLSETATRFYNLYGEGSNHGDGKELISGSELKLSLVVSSSNRLVETSKEITVVTNSLFADDSTSTDASIAYGRHLQNLDEGSHLPSSIESATQIQDIFFTNDSERTNDWYDCYAGKYYNLLANGTANFKPIANSNIKSYNGNDFRVSGLNISTRGNSGLFASINGGVTINNLSLTGSRIKGNVAGALVGAVSGENNKISNVRVYLDPYNSELVNKTEKDYWIEANTYGGGLVGNITGGDLTVSQSFASSVIKSSNMAGGISGGVSSGASLNLSETYTDSYLTGRITGGMVANGNIASMANCYTAGYQTASSSAAGFVNGTVSSAVNCYTICSMDSSAIYSTSLRMNSISNVYYFAGSSDSNNNLSGTEPIGVLTSEQLCEILGGDSGYFTTRTSNTVPYNLMNQALTTYTYPRLKVNAHYGDWQAKFRMAALVYYEKYSDNRYGFYGANIPSSLRSTVAVGDGYGIIFRSTDSFPDSVEVKIGDRTEKIIIIPGQGETATDFITVKYDDVQYRIYPLSVSLLNSTPSSSTSFYQEVEITAISSGTETSETCYYNPHFAKTVYYSDTTPELYEVYVRTARQLHNMSLYYDDYYANSTAGITYTQEIDIAYSTYDWERFASSGKITSQAPIGASSSSPFKSVYNGRSNRIKDISFISESGYYIGLFGYNTGTVSNVVLAADYNPGSSSFLYVQRRKNITLNETVYVGVLTGYNDGTIRNSATAGYYLAGSEGTLHAYTNGVLYAGGLVGGNNGSISNSSSDCPMIRLSNVYADVKIGGFVGWNRNSGLINDCYGIGHIEIADSRGGSVYASGFAGLNSGRITSSYCAVSITTTGENTYSFGFAPKSGFVENCYYLDNGTYSYIGTLRAYNFDSSNTSGTSYTYLQLRDSKGSALANASRSYNHPNTGNGGSVAYPFRAVVTNSSGAYVHYGDWQDSPNLGSLGVFYWEHEESGTNSGYHITYIGTNEGNSDSGTNLCDAHDDGGIITDYGYGYYVKEGQENNVKISNSVGLVSSYSDSGSVINQIAAAELHEQMKEYTFYPFTTKVSDSGDYIYLDNRENQFGTWTLTFSANTGESTSYEYSISPFFANAMKRNNTSGSIIVETFDGRDIDFSKDIGEKDNSIEIRSVQQIQYINWNYAEKNTSTLVNLENRMEYPYLQYATVITNGKQSKADAIANRPIRYFVQSHDLNGNDVAGYTPIAGMATSSKQKEFKNFLYAWFGNSYDGQSYKIQNLNIISNAYTVGLFGVTVGADINNIILYGNGNTVVKRSAEFGGTVGQYDVGAYMIGGLVALAYDYDVSNPNLVSTITNCAIAGYQIIDKSSNPHGLGGGNVGGLFGIAQVKLNKCSSVVDVILGSTNVKQEYAQYGNSVRAGGLAGAALYEVKDCYTGGSIKVEEATKNEKPKNYNSETKTTGLSRSQALHIYIGGIAGSCYRNSIINFGNQAGMSDSTIKLSNCYTYTSLPDIEGSIRAVSVLIGQADRFHRGSKITADNCYCLKSTFDGIDYNPPGYYFNLENNGNPDPKYSDIVSSGQYMLTDEDVEEIKNGNLDSLCKIVVNQWANYTSQVKPDPSIQKVFSELSDDTMSSYLGDNWGWVTIIDQSGASIDGKYSFSPNPAQEGKNYPFPTIITQKDLTYSTKTNPLYVNVHYGEWPASGSYFENGRDSMDIFADMNFDADPVPEGGYYAEKTFRFFYDSEFDTDIGPSFSFAPAGKVDLVSAEIDRDHNCYNVILRALTDGSVIVTESGQSDASFILSITADLNVSSDPESLLVSLGSKKGIVFTAKDDKGRDYSTKDYGSWVVSTTNESEAELLDKIQGTDINSWYVGMFESGKYTLQSAYTYNYHNGSTYVIGDEPYTYDENLYSNTVFFEINVLGYIGVTNGTEINGLIRRSEAGTYNGESLEITLDKISGPDFLLFASANNEDFADFVIKEISVTPEGGSEIIVYSNEDGFDNTSDYEVTVDNEVISRENYSYRNGYVIYSGTGDSPAVSLKAILSDPENNDVIYYLNIGVPNVFKYKISFDANGGEGTIYDHGSSGSFALPECEFTKTGYTFAGWTRDDDTNVYQPEDVVEGIDKDTVFKAKWIANQYKIILYANGGMDEEGNTEIEIDSCTYDEDIVLPLNTFKYDSAYVFNGWNSEPSGTGVSYSDGATVRNLTSEPDDEVTLYAQWLKRKTLYLYNGSDLHYSEEVSGSSLGSDYLAPTMDGWTLEGWYTEGSTISGIKVLNADGTINEPDVDGYTEDGSFALTDDKNLYAIWSRYAFLQVSSLDNGSDDDGIYMIVSSNEAGSSKNAMSVNSSNSITNNSSVEISSGKVYDDYNNSYSIFIFDSNDYENAKWSVKYNSDITDSTGCKYYSFIKNDRVLRRKDTQTFEMYIYNESNRKNNKHLWSYGKVGEYRMVTQFNISRSETSLSVYFNGTKWVSDNGDGVSYLFRYNKVFSYNMND